MAIHWGCWSLLQGEEGKINEEYGKGGNGFTAKVLWWPLEFGQFLEHLKANGATAFSASLHFIYLDKKFSHLRRANFLSSLHSSTPINLSQMMMSAAVPAPLHFRLLDSLPSPIPCQSRHVLLLSIFVFFLTANTLAANGEFVLLYLKASLFPWHIPLLKCFSLIPL
jgi:hypothetical protein